MSDQATTASATPYRVLARKYRPQDFTALIGQEALVRTLTNAFATGRIAQAYMLTGVRGIGKTTTARLIARALNYPAGPSVDLPEMTEQCAAILESRHIDVIEMDAASNTGVDNMREIIDSVRYAPVQARTKVYIIDEVHMLSKSAFNALLKTLEEPPPHVKFIFATTEIRKVPVTILSRCQRFDLKRLDAALLMQHYGRIAALENATIEEEALRMIARAAEGSVRDGLSLLDQAIAYGDGMVKADDVSAMLGLSDRARVIDLFDAVMQGDAARAMAEMNVQHQAGGDPQTILTDLADFVHYVTRLKVARESALLDGARTESEKARGSAFADKLTNAALSRAWAMLLKGISETATAPNPMQAADMVIVRLCHAADLPPTDELARIARQSTPAAPAPSPTPGLPQSRTFHQTMGPSAVASGVALARDSASAEPPATQAASATFKTFADVIALASEKRDVKLKGELERFVRPIIVTPTRIEFALEPHAPPGLTNELSRKLEAWTGRRIMVSLARDGGAEPAQKIRKSREAQSLADARVDPAVIAILQAFPGAEITAVREPAMPTLSPDQTTEDTDEESL